MCILSRQSVKVLPLFALMLLLAMSLFITSPAAFAASHSTHLNSLPQVNSPLYLTHETSNDTNLDSNAEGDVYMHVFNGSFFQQWTFDQVEGDVYNLRNMATGRVLDSNFEGNVYTSVANGGDRKSVV